MSAAPVLWLPDGQQHQVPIRKAGLGGVIGAPISAAPGALGDGNSASSLIGQAQASRVSDLDIYYMLATKHPAVNACVTLTADAVAAEGWEIVPKAGGLDRMLTDDVDPRVADIRAFFDLASPNMTDRGRLYSIASDLRTFGFCGLRKKRAPVNGRKIVASLERIDPRTLTIRANQAGTAVDKFLIRRRQSNGLIATIAFDEVDPKDIVFFSTTGGDPLTGFSSPLEALDLTLATDWAQRRFREAFCRLGAKAGMVLTSDTYDEDAFKVAEQEIQKSRSGADNAYKTLLLPGGWKMVKAPNAGQDDADFVKATALNREDVCMVYRVPVGMLTFTGTALGSAGKGEDQDFFEQFAVLPLEELIYERLTIGILRDEFGITDLEIVPRRRNKIRADRFAAAVQMVQFGATGDEAREYVNLPKTGLPTMNVPLFLKVALPNGLSGQEPSAPPETPPAIDGSGESSRESAAAADDAHEVAQKGKGRFRRARQGY